MNRQTLVIIPHIIRKKIGNNNQRLTFVIGTLFVLFLMFLAPSVSCADDNFGLGLVALSTNEEEEAIRYFIKSHSKNSMIIIRKIQFPESFNLTGVDYNDPTFNGFYAYVEILSHMPKYLFFAKIKEELDARNPNKELGRLGIFNSAEFSPKSKFLIINTSHNTFVLEAAGGKLLEMNDSMINEINTEITFSNDDRHILRYQESPGEEGDKKVSYEDFISKKKYWEIILKDRVDVKFSKDCSKAWIFNYEAGVMLTPLTIYKIDVKTGKQLSKKLLKAVPIDRVDSYIDKPKSNMEITDEGVDSWYSLYSPNKELYFAGNRTYGNFVLKRAKDGEIIRNILFHSDIE